MDADPTSNLVALGLEGELGIYNLNGLQSGNTTVNVVSIGLNSPINCVAIRTPPQKQSNLFKQDERTIVASGTDGRLWVGSIKLSPGYNKSDLILFKAHAKSNCLFQVNVTGFSKYSHYSMYTAASDGILMFWDIEKKNKLSGFTVGDYIPITAGDISHDSKFFVFSLGYDWCLGAWGTERLKMRPKIFMMEISAKEHERSI